MILRNKNSLIGFILLLSQHLASHKIFKVKPIIFPKHPLIWMAGAVEK